MNHKRTPYPIKTVGLFSVIWLFLSCAATFAEEADSTQWSISADKITRYNDPPSVIAEGNVVLQKKQVVERVEQAGEGVTDWDVLTGEVSAEERGRAAAAPRITETVTMSTIKADWLVYDFDLSTVKARGNISVQAGTDLLLAQEAMVELNQETGTFTNATLVSDYKDIHLQGRVIEKTGPSTYKIQDGWVITCKLENGETPPWSFASANAEVTVDGYTVLEDATFRIKDVPVLYSPYLIVPTKQTRQSGFLFPGASFSDRDGFGLELPFFINTSPSSDITLYPAYKVNRGVMPGMEFRYVLSDLDKGTFMGNYLDDALSDPSETAYYSEGDYTHTNQERYWLRGKVDQELNDWTTRLDLDIVSDRDYLREFNSDITGFKASDESFYKVFGRGFQDKTLDQRENSLRMLRSWDGLSLQGELLAINDVSLEEDEEEGSPLWKLPSADFSGLLPVADTTADFSWESGYVDYWREEGVGGHRLDLHPQLSVPLPISAYLETTAKAGVRNTSYLVREYGEEEWSGSDSENRFLTDFETEVATTLMRDFSYAGEEVYAWTHTLRPFVRYNNISGDDSDSLPQFDSVDELEAEDIVTYGMDNFVSVLGKRGTGHYERRYGYLKVEQGYDLAEEMSDAPLTPVLFKVKYNPLPEVATILKNKLGVYGEGFTYHSVEAAYENNRGDWLAVDFRKDVEESLESIKTDAQITLLPQIAAGYSIERSLEDGQTIEEDISLIYQPACWAVEIMSHTAEGDHKILLLFSLANLGNTMGVDLPRF